MIGKLRDESFSLFLLSVPLWFQIYPHMVETHVMSNVGGLLFSRRGTIGA